MEEAADNHNTTSTFKRAGAEGLDAPRKLSKSNHPNEDDFSTSVRKKLSSSARTGQACDRCKVRKIKCDGSAGGCSPCQQASHICKTTDRNNGRTTVRGHADRLEWENMQLREKLEDAERQLRDMGVVVEEAAQPVPRAVQSSHHSGRRDGFTSWPQHPGEVSPAQQTPDVPRTYIAPAADPTGQSVDAGLSILNGTTLSLFGMQIDVVRFTNSQGGIDAPMTHETFIKYAYGQASVPAPELPPTYGEAKRFAAWYFSLLNPFTPVLDKVDFAQLLQRRYEKPEQPLVAAEDVMIHMMFGELKFQHGQRNHIQSFTDQAFAHYKYSLTRFSELLLGRTLSDVQALLLIAFKLRSFPSPGAAMMCSQQVLNIALGMNLHRSASALPESLRRMMPPREIEIRKRVFWTTYALSTGLNGKLGLPIPLPLDAIDIEIPEPIDDTLPDEEIMPSDRRCSFKVGIAMIRLMRIQSQLYTNIFGIRRTSQNYISESRRLEVELEEWRAVLPPEMADHATAEREFKVAACYNRLWELETRFLLYHAVMHSATNPELYTSNAKISLETSSDILSIVGQIHALKCLDPPWINVTLFLACIFTTLFIQDQRQDELSHTEIQKLEQDMSEWLSIFRDVGYMLGTGMMLFNSTQSVVEKVVGNIKNRTTAKAAAAVAAHALQQQTAQTNDRKLTTINAAPYTTSDSQLTSGVGRSETGTKSEKRGPYLSVENSSTLPAAQQAFQQQQRPDTGFTYLATGVENSQIYQGSRSTFPEPVFSTTTGDGISVQQHMQQIPMSTGNGVPTPQAMYTLNGGNGTAFYSEHPIAQPAAEWARWSQLNLPLAALPVEVSPDFVSPASALVALGGRGAQDMLPPTRQQNMRPGTTDTSNWPLSMFSPEHHHGQSAG